MFCILLEVESSDVLGSIRLSHSVNVPNMTLAAL